MDAFNRAPTAFCRRHHRAAVGDEKARTRPFGAADFPEAGEKVDTLAVSPGHVRQNAFDGPEALLEGRQDEAAALHVAGGPDEGEALEAVAPSVKREGVRW